MMCRKITVIVNDLAKEYASVLKVQVTDVGTADSKAKIKEYGFERHGLVMFDAAGKVAHLMDGHKWTNADIRKQLAIVMGGS
jgi:hypothetical protein